ncbi:MAG: site-2 protease family protein [Clostridia bacterium]|nr:site-2 protease family protein [Clostridia bacterium]
MLEQLQSMLPTLLLSLPVALISLSVHESAHGYVANKLGDPTAKNLGRITLNPMKHFDLLGFVSMLLFRVGWANPVPINARNFKNPRRDMAISAAAGPLSNLCLAFIFAILLKLLNISYGFITFTNETAFLVMYFLEIMLLSGVILNLNLMIFNLIPIPPFDGSRILYVFLPTDLYFKVMRYEKYIMLAFILLFATGALDGPLSFLTNLVMRLMFKLLGL